MNTDVPEALTFPPSRGANPLDPPPDYMRYRAESPITRLRSWDGSSVWVVTKWEDVRAVLSSPSFSVAPTKPGYPTVSPARAAQVKSRQTFIHMDPPDHTSFRRMLTKEFTARRLEELRPTIQNLVDRLLDEMIAAGPTQDLVEMLATPLPSRVISMMLGIPYKAQDDLQIWSKTRNDHSVDPALVQQAARNMEVRLSEILAAKEADPGDGGDLLSRLVIEQIAPGHLSHLDAVRMISLVYSAGHGTTASQIALGTLSFLRNPAQRDALVTDPALLAGAVEEMLRYNSITHFNSARVATADTMIGGQMIRAGEGVYALVAAANRDPDVFADPDSFDIHRDARRHMAFSFGVHQCIGQSLARLELNIVFGTLFKRLPELRLAGRPEDLKFRQLAQVYAVEALPVDW